MNPGAAQQMLLPLRPAPAPSFDNFATGANGELVASLRALDDPRNAATIHVWGAKGAGKSHLLAATAAHAAPRRPVLWLGDGTAGDTHPIAPGTLIIADDVAALDAAAQTYLFRLFNAARLTGLALLVAADAPATELAMREDLRTRIGQCLAYQILPPSDDERRDALRRHAAQRGMRLEPMLIEYLLRHGRRDLPSLMQVLDELDLASLRARRMPTLPLLRELLQSHPERNPT